MKPVQFSSYKASQQALQQPRPQVQPQFAGKTAKRANSASDFCILPSILGAGLLLAKLPFILGAAALAVPLFFIFKKKPKSAEKPEA